MRGDWLPLAGRAKDSYISRSSIHKAKQEMIPLINFIAYVIGLYIWIIIAAAIMSWLIAFGVVNTHNKFVYAVTDFLYRITEPAIAPIRRYMPNLGGIDISPLVLILLLIFIRDVVLFGWIAPAFI
jgi:YggT family protein